MLVKPYVSGVFIIININYGVLVEAIREKKVQNVVKAWIIA